MKYHKHNDVICEDCKYIGSFSIAMSNGKSQCHDVYWCNKGWVMTNGNDTSKSTCYDSHTSSFDWIDFAKSTLTNDNCPINAYDIAEVFAMMFMRKALKTERYGSQPVHYWTRDGEYSFEPVDRTEDTQKLNAH